MFQVAIIKINVISEVHNIASTAINEASTRLRYQYLDLCAQASSLRSTTIKELGVATESSSFHGDGVVTDWLLCMQ
jgi:hypothetical protein